MKKSQKSLAEQSLQDIQRFMNPGARTSNVMGTTQAKKLRATRDALRKAGEEYSENPVNVDDFDIANNDEISANITKFRNPPKPEPTPEPAPETTPSLSITPSTSPTPDRVKQIARTTRQDFDGGRQIHGPSGLSPLYMRQLELGAKPVTQAEIDAAAPKTEPRTPQKVVPQAQASSNAIEAAKKRVAARQAATDAQDRFSQNVERNAEGIRKKNERMDRAIARVRNQEKKYPINNPGLLDPLYTNRDPETFDKGYYTDVSPEQIQGFIDRPSALQYRQWANAVPNPELRNQMQVQPTTQADLDAARSRLKRDYDFTWAGTRVDPEASKGAAAYALNDYGREDFGDPEGTSGDTPPRLIPGHTGELTKANPEYFKKLKQASNPLPAHLRDIDRSSNWATEYADRIRDAGASVASSFSGNSFEKIQNDIEQARKDAEEQGVEFDRDAAFQAAHNRHMGTDAIDFLLDPLPKFSRRNIFNYVKQQATDKVVEPVANNFVEPTLDRIRNIFQPADNTATSVSRETAQQAARTGQLEPFFGTASKAADTPDDFMRLRTNPWAGTGKSNDPFLGAPGKGSDTAAEVAAQQNAIRTGQVRVEPTFGTSTPTVQTSPPSTTIADLLKGTQADPIPSTFPQGQTRVTGVTGTSRGTTNTAAASDNFVEPKNFTQLQRLYNQGQITPQQYETYANKFLTAESKLEYIRTMFREA